MASQTTIPDWIDVAAEMYPTPEGEDLDQSIASDTTFDVPASDHAWGFEEYDSTPDSMRAHPTSYPDDWDTRQYNIEMTFSNRSDWMAVMKINAKDVPALMINGIYWNEDNVDPTKGHLLYRDQLTADQRSSGWEYARKYYLQDIEESPQWVAEIEVVANEIPELSQFRVDHLTMDLLDQVRAWNWDEFEIYKYNSWTSIENYNAIYDDMPLGEGWPQI